MEMTSRETAKGHGLPRHCPRCGWAETLADPLCPECGETLVEQGYCAICEDFLSIPPGMLCPKHDVELDEGPAPLLEGLAPGETPTWVTVATYHDTLEAEAPRIRLEAEGIATFLEGERMGSRSMYQVATGGVKLQVPEALVPDARVILAQSWTSPVEDDDLDDAWDELAPEPWALRRSIMKGVIIFILVAPLLMMLISWCFPR